jgi:hypothetical protein
MVIALHHTDDRPPISQLYHSYGQLTNRGVGIHQNELYEQHLLQSGSTVSPPVLSLRSSATGPALWVLAGIHGEEPAGPAAIAQNVDLFVQLARSGIPFVLLPLCNPVGYLLDWRYPNIRRQQDSEGLSVGDCTHLLPSTENPNRPRRPEGPACPEAEALGEHILSLMNKYPPFLSIDLHEDEMADPCESYVYSQGEMRTEDPVALDIVSILERCGFAVPRRGITRFGEPILNGVIGPTKDGSIDELLSSPLLVRDGLVIPGPGAKTVIVVETPTHSVPLARRVAAHAEILHALPRWCLPMG